MQLVFRTRGIALTDDLRQHVQRRLGFALARVAHAVRRVLVLVEDTNGPERGGADKRCRVYVRGPRLGELIVEANDLQVTSAIDRAADRLGHLASRVVARVRDVRL